MEIYKDVLAVKNEGVPAVLATVVEVAGSAPGRRGAKMLVKADHSIVGTIGGGAVEKRIIDEALMLMGAGEGKLCRYTLEDIGMACGGAMSVFLDPVVRVPELIVFGAGHIGTALSSIAKMLGFAVTVADNRQEFADEKRLHWADKILSGDYQDMLPGIEFSDNVYAVIMTHRHMHDFEILAYCAQQPFAYLGMIGSRNKVSGALQRLRDSGASEETIRRIHAPIGMKIGGNAPAEIAVAIAAELVAVRNGADSKKGTVS